MKTIYLDNAATTYPKPEAVYQAVDRYSRELGGNPGRGSSRRTLESGALLLEAREELARLFNIKDAVNIAFMQNVTAALNTALKGFLKQGDHVITSSMEHNAVARPLTTMARRGVEWTQVQCDPEGCLDPDNVKKAIRPNTRMICLLHASNLTGTIMPLREIGQIARQYGIAFLVDAAQSAGILPIDVEEQGIDMLAFTGHKGLLGPQGTGGLYVRPGIILEPLIEGGTGSLSEELDQPLFMPDRLESGTQNGPGIAGLLAGVRFIKEVGMDNIRRHEQKLTRCLLDGLKEIPGVTVYGPDDETKRTAVVAFNIEGIDCGEVSLQLDYRYGIVTRSGLHCAPLAHRTIGTLEQGACRISPGYFNTIEDVELAVRAVRELALS